MASRRVNSAAQPGFRFSGSDQAGRVPGVHELLEGLAHLIGHRLGDGEALVRVDLDPLGIADQHVHHPVRIADAGHVVVQGQRQGCALDAHLRPELPTGRVGPTLLIRTRDQRDRLRLNPTISQQLTAERDVFSGVPGFRLDQDRLVRDSQLEGVSVELPLYTANPDDFKGCEELVDVVAVHPRPNRP